MFEHLFPFAGLVQTNDPEPSLVEESLELGQSELGHSRSSSYNSQQSRASGYSSAHSVSSGFTEHFSSATSLTDLPEKEQMKDSWSRVGTNERRRVSIGDLGQRSITCSNSLGSKLGKNLKELP